MTVQPPTELADAFAETKAAARKWLNENWDPDIDTRTWWARLEDSGWGFPDWPNAWGGRDLPSWARVAVGEAIRELGALAPPDGPGQSFGAQVLLGFGTDDQRRRFLPVLARGEELWCQFFSEPSAGSDLAAMRTRAELRDGRWVINGQKTWSSAAQFADRGLLLARTNLDVPKHRGISLFLISTDQPGVTIRPIRQMNDRSEFTEVFFDDAEVAADGLIGEVDQGWQLATMVLAFERQEAGGTGPAPGARAGLLDARAGDVAAGVVSGPTVGLTVGAGVADLIIDAARTNARADDLALRLAVAEVFVLDAAVHAVQRRVWSLSASGTPPGPGGSVGKLMFSRLIRASRDLAADLLAERAGIEAPPGSQEALLQEVILTVPGLTVGQGTEEIQRNILSERVLGMPRERLIEANGSEVKVAIR